MSSAPSRPTTRVEVARSENVATIQFVSDSGVNILSSGVIAELGAAVERLAEDATVRFVVLRGIGKTFVAGADIEQMSHFTEADGLSFSKNGHHVFDGLENMPQMTIAAINGAALGGGLEVALACDFRIAAAPAKLGLPESRLGLIPGWGGTTRLSRLIGPARAKRLMFSGDTLTAADALALGVVDEVVPTSEDLDAATQRWFAAVAPGSPAAIRRIKKALRDGNEIERFSRCFSCSDAREGMTAFLEKRKPYWTNWKDVEH